MDFTKEISKMAQDVAWVPISGYKATYIKENGLTIRRVASGNCS
jgi:translation elongation factor EF-1alpha